MATLSPTTAVLLIALLSLYGVHCSSIEKDRLSTYRVAVFEYAIPYGRTVGTSALAYKRIKTNIAVYNQTAIRARLKGAKMLVFPEYGISNLGQTRKSISLFAEIIPNPKISKVNPCKDPEFKGQNKVIQRLLSCIARENEMFLVANMAGRERCTQMGKCPSDRQYLYNTNVVFSPTGELVARYYKTHLYNEKYFNRPNQAEVVTFDTPFGKFGTFVCFDVMFKNPVIEAVEKYNIHNFATPTAWVKVTPIFRSIQMHSSFARGQKINFLVSNLHSSRSTSYGSGIYTPKGAAAYYYRPMLPNSKLILADIHSVDYNKPKMSKSHFNHSQQVKTKYYDTVISAVSHNFEFTFLTNQSGSLTVCYGSFCCKASYVAEQPFQEIYAVAAYSGYWGASGNKLYTQICTILKCPSYDCGREIDDVQTKFSHISLQGIGFSTKYIYPYVLAMRNYQYVLMPDSWTYSKGKGIENRHQKTINLHSAALIGRVYSKDILATVQKEQPRQIKKTFLGFLSFFANTFFGFFSR